MVWELCHCSGSSQLRLERCIYFFTASPTNQEQKCSAFRLLEHKINNVLWVTALPLHNWGQLAIFFLLFFRNGLVKRLVLLNFAVPSRTEQLIFCLINLPLRVSWSLDPVYLHIFAPLRAGSSAAVLKRKGVLDDTVLDKQPNPVEISPHRRVTLARVQGSEIHSEVYEVIN